MKNFIYLLLIVFFVLLSCGRDNSDETTNSTSQTTKTRKMSLTINGSTKVYNTVSFSSSTSNGVVTKVITGSVDGSSSDNMQLVFIGNLTGTNAFDPDNVSLNYGGKNYYYDFTNFNAFQVNVVQNDTSKLKGTFSGSLVNSVNSTNTYATTQSGSFEYEF